jgi:hypothetical protein
MKKIIIALALAASSSVAMAAVTTVCNATPTPTNVPGRTDGTLFVRATFAPTCSTNTIMQVDDDGTKVWGASASIKGQSVFGGSTNGGSVGKLANCNAGKACGTAAATTTTVSGQMTAAAALGNT